MVINLYWAAKYITQFNIEDASANLQIPPLENVKTGSEAHR
jgi:hypothetical protein